MEVLGAAASVAGLVGLSGQLLSGIIFLKDFISDVKNAPEDLKSLSREVELLADIAIHADRMITSCGQCGVKLAEAEYKPAIEQCIDVVQKMKDMVEGDMKNLGGKAKWLDRLRSAAGKKQVESYMVRVERMKTQVMMIELTLTLQLQQQQQLALARTTSSLQSIENQSRNVATWTKSLDLKLDEFSTEMVDIKSQLRGVTASLDSVHRTGPTHSAIEAMIESVVSRELKKHQQEVSFIEHNKNLFSSSGISYRNGSLQPDTAMSDSNQMIPFANRILSEPLDNSIPPSIFNLTRQDKVIYRSQFRAPFIRIEIVTTEVRRRKKAENLKESHGNLPVAHKSKFTEYHVWINLPFWKSFNVFRRGNINSLYGNNFYRSLKTYNVVPSDAPIITACLTFDVLEAQKLFETGAASPYDVSGDYDSLLLVVIAKLSFERDHHRVPSNALEMITFLMNSVGGNMEVPLPSWWLQTLFVAARDNPKLSAYMDIIRFIASHTLRDPFDDVYSSIIINDPFHPFYSILSSQEIWDINTNIKTSQIYRRSLRGCFVETSRDMINDPLGLSLQKALSKGITYVPFSYGEILNYHCFNETQYSPLHLLLAFAARAKHELQNACITRLAILLRYQYDPRQPQFFTSLFGPREQRLALTPTQFAEFVGIQQIWELALVEAGWSTYEIQGLKDDDAFFGLPALFEGKAVYSTLVEQRVDIIEKLRCGYFDSMDIGEVYEVADSMRFELECLRLQPTFDEAWRCFKRFSNPPPGSWVLDENIRLQPGVDFELPRDWINCENDVSEDWKCIREVHRWKDEDPVHHCLFPEHVSCS